MVIYGKLNGIDIWFNVLDLNAFWHADAEADLSYTEEHTDNVGWCKKKDVVINDWKSTSWSIRERPIL